MFFCSFLAGAMIETPGQFSVSMSGMLRRYFVVWLPIAIWIVDSDCATSVKAARIKRNISIWFIIKAVGSVVNLLDIFGGGLIMGLDWN